ncbi:hypothetical protein QE430_001724 [Microbacterium testaceum]|uniref:hypothetical protein n=1 Tax=Microbacterium testaceum TaxID=2033 RepID=UPI0027859DA1|nr:hypothetical protein [Microbacterium testaceum]MDQ1173417.1 hypothetical protein [Microbacterium testaceum]
MAKTEHEELIAAIQSMDRKLSALLSIVVDQHLRRTPDLANPRPRNIDRILSDAGMLGTEIAATLGKTPQAVSQALKTGAKSTTRPREARAEVESTTDGS